MPRYLYINSTEIIMTIAKFTKPETSESACEIGFGHICKLLYLSEPDLFNFDHCQEEH